MRLLSPQDGIDPRALAQEGEAVWTPVPNFPHIFASNLGELLDAKRRTPVAKHTNPRTGYVSVRLRPLRQKQYAHRILLYAFDGPGSLAECLGSRDDLRLCNWRWRKARGRLTPAERELILALLQQGVPQVEIARRLALNPNRVSYYACRLKQHG